MPVYVDPMMGCVKSSRWPYTKACHMFADSDQELHAFAARLGLSHRWFQTPARKYFQCVSFHHYDLTEGKRAEAVRMGAIELNRRDAVNKWVQLRYLPPERRREEAVEME